MIYPFIEILKQKLLSLSEEERVKYLEQILIITYGSEDLARARFEEIASKAKDTNELDFLINEELNTEASNTLLRMFKGENISGLINDFNTISKSHESITTKISNPRFVELLLEKQKEIAELTFQTLYNLPGESSREEMAVAMLPDFYFTKQEIALEFGVDIKTFNKWLEIIFPDTRYDNRRRLNILEYKNIFEKLFLAQHEDVLNIIDHLNFYVARVSTAMNLSKGDLIDNTDSDYKTLRANVSTVIPEYASLNIFPYSIAMKMLSKMGEPTMHAPRQK